MDEAFLKVGELARRSGVSVRTLHHYDELGLLKPTLGGRGEARLYGPAQVARLWRIRALQGLGLSLEEVGACLSGAGPEPLALVERQLAQIEARIALAERLRARLERIAEALRAARVPDTDTLLETIEMNEHMEHFERYYTPDQKQQLAERATQVGAERMRAVQDDWRELFDAFREAHARGAAPDSAPVLALARRARALIEEFTGGDAGIRASLARAYAEHESPASVWGVEPEVAELMGAAQRALEAQE